MSAKRRAGVTGASSIRIAKSRSASSMPETIAAAAGSVRYGFSEATYAASASTSSPLSFSTTGFISAAEGPPRAPVWM
jgi:hypothetical protein